MPPLDSKDIAELYEQYRTKVVRYLISLSGDPEVSEELAQDVFTQAFSRREEFRSGKEQFLSWALIVARNAYYNYHRKNKRSMSRPPETFNDLTLDESDTPEKKIEKKFLKKYIVDAIHCLPEPEKSVMIYREVYGKTLEDTARSMKLSIRTVSRRTLSALKLLRQELEKRGIGPE